MRWSKTISHLYCPFKEAGKISRVDFFVFAYIMLNKTIDFLNIIILHIHLANIAMMYSFQAERQKISLIQGCE
jgi:hypothetical protein